MQHWTGVELPLARFIELCRLAGRMSAPVVTFLPDGIAYLESPDRPKRRLHGDYAFLHGFCETDAPITIPVRELEATYRLLGLERDRPTTVRGQTVRIAPGTITVLPQERRYQRRLLAFPVKTDDAERLATLAAFRPAPNLGYTPTGLGSRFAPLGRSRAHLTLGEQLVYETRGEARVAGTATIEGTVDIVSRPGRALLALCEHAACRDGRDVAGHFTGDVLFLWAGGVLARIYPNDTTNQRKEEPTWQPPKRTN